jgi:uncharacterized protein YkwD
MRWLLLFALATSAACGANHDDASSPAGATSGATSGGDEQVEEHVVIEKQPDGSTKKTTIRTTKRTVPATPPPARPADPYPSDPLVRYNVERVNAYRNKQGLTPLLYDKQISAFARAGSDQYAQDHTPHAHFAANAEGGHAPPGFGSKAAENQGDPNGVPALASNATQNGQLQIDTMMKLMMDEGPGGGHYDNMMNPKYRRIGIGLYYAGGKLYLTNDFSD